MIYYIKNVQSGRCVFPNDDQYHRSAYGALNELCRKHLFELSGYLKVVKRILDIKYRTPIYVTHQMIFIPTKALHHYDNVFVNYYAINHIKIVNDRVYFYFPDDSYLNSQLSMTSYKRLVMTIFKILKYKESLE